jgi:hypothetical protein
VGGLSVGTLTLTGTTHSDAGDYPADAWSFAGGTNYNDAAGTVHDVIAKINAVVSVIPYAVDYDGNPHTATGTAKGLGGLSVGTLTLTGTTHSDAGDYPADAWSFTGGTNYNDASGTVHDVIAKIDASISVTPYHVNYDGNAHTATGTAKGLGGLDVGTLTLTGTTHTSAGDYTSDAWSFTGGTNYNDANGTTHDQINKANPTVHVTGGIFTYDGHQHPATGSVTGVGGASLGTPAIAYTPGTGAPVTPGTYTAVGTFVGDGNYNPATDNATVQINFGVCNTSVGSGGVILPPINSDGTSVYNRKGGSTIPVKFRVCDASGNSIPTASAVFSPVAGGALTMLSAVRGTVGSDVEPAINASPDVAFRWDASGQQWIFNMATTNLEASTTYVFRVNLGTGGIQFKVAVK